jgi:hypothetical protein
MDERTKQNTIEMAKDWRNAVRRGDVTADYAATEVAGKITYPYAEVAHFEAVRALARNVLSKL